MIVGPLIAAPLIGGFCSAALAQQVDLAISGALETDLRYRLETVEAGTWYQPLTLPAGFSRNNNTFNLEMKARGARVTSRSDVDLVLTTFPNTSSIDELARRDQVDPYRLETHALYIEAWDVMLPGLDLRVGQQLVQWGAGDQFNPTNNLNADDLEDPLRFGDQLANVMIRADYRPRGTWGLTGALVPVFKPALLPPTGGLALSELDRIPVGEEELRWLLLSEQGFADEVMGFPTVVGDVAVELPESTAQNMQFAVALDGAIGMQDVALSYYRGRSDFPQPVANHTTQSFEAACDPADDTDCISGMLLTDVTVAYPRMQVIGLNSAGEVNPLGWISDVFHPIGYRMEFAWIIPEDTRITLTNDELDLGGIVQASGEYDHYGLSGERPAVIDSQPFAKWVVGLDYTLTRALYLNVQWVHGLPDEFGAGDWLFPGEAVRAAGVDGDTLTCSAAQDGSTCAWETTRPRIGDYAVAGLDIRIGDTLCRVFGLVDLSGATTTQWSAESGKRTTTEHSWRDEAASSAVLYPEITYNFGNGLEMSGGALLLFGGPDSKFNEPAAGGDQVFGRARYRF